MTEFHSAVLSLQCFSHHSRYGIHGFRFSGSGDSKFLIANGWCYRLLSRIFKNNATHKNAIQTLLNRQVAYLQRGINTEQRITQIAQKYNQALANHQNKECFMGLHFLTGTDVEPLATRVEKTSLPLMEDGTMRRPYFTNSHFFGRRCYYNEADFHIDHGAEAMQIFKGTQLERLLCLVGRIIRLFFRNTNFFKRLEYFRLDETDEDIYSTDTPNTTPTQASSYWWGHASCMLSIALPPTDSAGPNLPINILTDPVEGDLNKILYPSQTRCGCLIEELPLTNIYLLSHNHLDHYNAATISKLLEQQPTMIVPMGDGGKYRAMGFENIQEVEWWDKIDLTVTKGEKEYTCTITTVPSNHWSGQKGFIDANKSHFLGYVIHSDAVDGDIYFAGDTARLDDGHLEDLRRSFNIRYQLQPAGPDEEREYMETTHQASVDGLWMHFELFVKKLAADHESRSKADFLAAVAQTKTIFMHTKKFKLGKLHFDDAETSVQKLKDILETMADEGDLYKRCTIAMLEEENPELEQALRTHDYRSAERFTNHLRYFEIQVLVEIMEIADQFTFNGEKLTPADILAIMESVQIPKIGQATTLGS